MFNISKYHKLYWKTAEDENACNKFDSMTKIAYRKLERALKVDPLPCVNHKGDIRRRYVRISEFSIIPANPCNDYLLFKHRDSRSIISFCPKTQDIHFVSGDKFTDSDNIHDYIVPEHN